MSTMPRCSRLAASPGQTHSILPTNKQCFADVCVCVCCGLLDIEHSLSHTERKAHRTLRVHKIHPIAHMHTAKTPQRSANNNTTKRRIIQLNENYSVAAQRIGSRAEELINFACFVGRVFIGLNLWKIDARPGSLDRADDVIGRN